MRCALSAPALQALAAADPRSPFPLYLSGNLLSQAKYPYMLGISLTAALRDALDIDSSTVGCGACVRIHCPKGANNQGYYCNAGQPSVIAVVTDICPVTSWGKTCQGLQMDMYTEAWKVIAHDSNPADTVVERVQCPSTGGNVKAYVFENHGSGGFLKLNFQDVGGSGVITDVSMACGGAPVTLKNQYGAVWVAASQPKHVGDCYFTLTTDDDVTVSLLFFIFLLDVFVVVVPAYWRPPTDSRFPIRSPR